MDDRDLRALPADWTGSEHHVAGVFDADAGTLTLHLDGKAVATTGHRTAPRQQHRVQLVPRPPTSTTRPGVQRLDPRRPRLRARAQRRANSPPRPAIPRDPAVRFWFDAATVGLHRAAAPPSGPSSPTAATGATTPTTATSAPTASSPPTARHGRQGGRGQARLPGRSPSPRARLATARVARSPTRTSSPTSTSSTAGGSSSADGKVVQRGTLTARAARRARPCRARTDHRAVHAGRPPRRREPSTSSELSFTTTDAHGLGRSAGHEVAAATAPGRLRQPRGAAVPLGGCLRVVVTRTAQRPVTVTGTGSPSPSPRTTGLDHLLRGATACGW